MEIQSINRIQTGSDMTARRPDPPAEEKNEKSGSLDAFEYTVSEEGPLYERYGKIATELMDASLNGRFSEKLPGKVEDEVTEEENRFFDRIREKADGIPPRFSTWPAHQQCEAFKLLNAQMKEQFEEFCKLLRD